MRVVVDGRTLVKPGRGVARVTRGMLEALATAYPHDEWVVVATGEVARPLSGATSAHYVSEPHEELARRRREVLLARRGPRALALDDVAQALTFATRTVARALAGRDAQRPAVQLRALARVRGKSRSRA